MIGKNFGEYHHTKNLIDIRVLSKSECRRFERAVYHIFDDDYIYNWDGWQYIQINGRKYPPWGIPRSVYYMVLKRLDYLDEPISRRKRFEILERDNFTCQYCGRSPRKDGVRVEVDHVKPRSKSGSSQRENLITACFDCNRGKGKRILRAGRDCLRPV